MRLGAKKDEAEFDDEWMVLAGEAPVQPQPLSEDLLKVIETVLLRCDLCLPPTGASGFYLLQDARPSR